MSFTDYIHLQIEEALGPVNKWYASEKAGYEITDKETLCKHYIKSGGAYDFSLKYKIEVKK